MEERDFKETRAATLLERNWSRVDCVVFAERTERLQINKWKEPPNPFNNKAGQWANSRIKPRCLALYCGRWALEKVIGMISSGNHRFVRLLLLCSVAEKQIPVYDCHSALKQHYFVSHGDNCEYFLFNWVYSFCCYISFNSLYNIYRLAFMATDLIYIEIHERFSTHARWFTLEANFIRTKKFPSYSLS